MRDKDAHGVLVGGHTIQVIRNAWDELAFVHTMMYEHPKNRQGYYMCGYLSIPRGHMDKLTDEEHSSLNITFEGIHAAWLDIPASFAGVRELIDFSYWIGIDYLSLPEEEQPTSDEVSKKLVELSGKIKSFIDGR
jgi:hypothetical protein